MTGFYLWLAAIVVGGGGLTGILALVLRNSKKAGQKQAEAEYAQTEVTNAKAAGIVIAEHRTPRDTSRKLRDGQF